MDLKKRMISLLLSLVLCGAVFVPPASSASCPALYGGAWRISVAAAAAQH